MKNSRVKSKLFCLFMAICVSLASIPMATQPTWGQEQSVASTPVALETTAREAEAQASNNQVLFSVPIGDTGILYEGVDTQATSPNQTEDAVKSLRWGPSALALGADGTFWVADDVGQRIRQYDATGALLTTIDTTERLRNVNDIAVTEHKLFALDMTDDRSILWELDLQGNTIITASLPITNEDGFTGITLDSAGALWLEQASGAYRTQLVSTANMQLASEEKQIIDRSAMDPHLATVTLGDTHIDIHTSHPIANVHLLQVTPTGDIFLAVKEIVATPKILVDQTVRHYKSDGTLLGLARVPLADQPVYVESNLAVAANNEVYALVPRLNQVEVQRLEFSLDLPAILPEADAQLNNQVFLPLVASDDVKQTDVNALALNGLEFNRHCGSATCTIYLYRGSSERLYQFWQEAGIGSAIPILCDFVIIPLAVGVCSLAAWARVRNFEVALADAHTQRACLAAKFFKFTGTFLWFSAANGQYCLGDLGYLLPIKPTPTNCPYPWYRTLWRGTRGADVKELQRRLNIAGAKPPLALDSDFGPLTLAAVKHFQGTHQLVADGIVGRLTKGELNKICN